MTPKLILVTGGARSGKSSTAEALVRAAGERRYYIATAPVLDDEMADRVRRHQAGRADDGWITIEEETELETALTDAARSGAEGILVDCLTLWINNLLYRDATLDESGMAKRVERLLHCLRPLPCTVVLVINEVGLGLVPESALARRFRDLSGRAAQSIAREADEVYFMIAGLKQRIK